jgi:succinyl-CoA synthetase beta subunit
VDINKELYLGFVVDRGSKNIVCIVSSMGGVDIEEVAKSHPDKVSRIYVDPRIGLMDFQLRNLFLKIGLESDIMRQAISIAKKLYNVFVSFDSELCEINPLVVTGDRKLIAADAVLNIDDNALFRHLEFEKVDDSPEYRARKAGLSYVELDGDIGIIGNGAGLVMATLDLVHFSGGEPANFCDVGGGARADRISLALNLILEKKGIKAILINIFGGITRCDEVAKGLIDAFEQLQLDLNKIPIVVRLAGTNREEGLKILSKLNLITVDTMEEAAKKVVIEARR